MGHFGGLWDTSDVRLTPTLTRDSGSASVERAEGALEGYLRLPPAPFFSGVVSLQWVVQAVRKLTAFFMRCIVACTYNHCTNGNGDNSHGSMGVI